MLAAAVMAGIAVGGAFAWFDRARMFDASRGAAPGIEPDSRLQPVSSSRSKGGCLVRIDPPELTADVDEDTTHVDFKFRIVNESGEPVTIQGTKPLCSCTVADLNTDRIGPFESAPFRVQYALGSQFGKLIPREVRLLTDSPACPEIGCRVGGVRRRTFEITPPQVDFGQLMAGAGASQVVTVRGAGATFAHDRIRTSDARLCVEDVREWTSGGSSTVEFRARFESTSATGAFDGRIEVPQVGDSRPVASVPIRAVVSAPVRLSPEVAFFGVVTPGDTPTCTVRLQVVGEAPLNRITGLAVESRLAALECHASAERAMLRLSLKAAELPPGAFDEALDVTCRFDEKEYQLRLPIRALIREKQNAALKRS